MTLTRPLPTPSNTVFNSWDRTPFRTRLHDTWGEPSWTPAETAIIGNLVLNAYGGSHNLDHDDGSEYMDSSRNVVAFAQACKGNYGSHRRCDGNLILLPGAHMYNATTGAGGGNCASESDNGKSSTYADKYFTNNTCLQVGKGGVATAYSWTSCSTAARNFNSTCWGDGGNTFLVDRGTKVVVACGNEKVPLEQWQSQYGREQGGHTGVMPALDEIIAMAERVLGL